ncbi:MAG TPA: hypothetical protein VFD28_03555 [Candidatus Eisenbacteria bacterium]|nr:hypothetical protein [Candidatus Eisenbacteria bacterium]
MTIIKEASTNDFSITASNKKAKDQVELLMKLMKIDAESKEDGGSTTYTMKVDADKLGKLKDASWTDGVKLNENSKRSKEV